MKTYGHMEAITDKRDTATAECFYVLFQKMKEHFIPVWCVLYTYSLGTLS